MTTAKEVTSQIWEMANRLRGNMDASEYRNYILGFMFYRYLSERQEKYLFDNKVFDENPDDISGITVEYVKEADGEYLADYLDDIAGSLGYAIEPRYMWRTIVNEVNNNTITPDTFQSMFESFDETV